MGKKYLPYIISFIAGAIICGVVTLWISHNSGAKLDAELSVARSSLAKLATDNTAAILTIRQVYSEVEQRNVVIERNQSVITEQQSTIDGQQQIIDGQQHTINDQKQILTGQQLQISQQQSAIDAIASNIANSGGDIGKTIKAIADGFARLYASYHPSTKASQAP